MNRLYSLKRILTFIIVFAVTAGIAGSSYNSSLKITSADTESSQGEDYSYTDSVADGGQQSDEQTENDDNSQEESTGFDITQYAEQLRELSKKQTEINEQLDKYDEDIEKSEKKQKLLKEKIDSINDEIDVLNSYMTALELQINTNQRNIDKKQAEINKGIQDFKQRLRAMYIAGSDSYTTMLLESDSFYDILMRLELIKRVAHHDDTIIDNLIKLNMRICKRPLTSRKPSMTLSTHSIHSRKICSVSFTAPVQKHSKSLKLSRKSSESRTKPMRRSVSSLRAAFPAY